RQATLQMSVSLAVRAIFDYNRLDSNAALFSDPASSGVMYDLLVRYLVHPGTAVYVGINRQYEGALTDQSSPLPLRWSNLPSNPIGQQVFVKMSYQFRFRPLTIALRFHDYGFRLKPEATKIESSRS